MATVFERRDLSKGDAESSVDECKASNGRPYIVAQANGLFTVVCTAVDRIEPVEPWPEPSPTRRPPKG